MRISPAARRHLRRFTPLLCLALLVLAGCAENYPQTTLAPKGDFARAVDTLFRSTVRWAVVVFVLVEGALIYAIVRYRSRPGRPEPAQFHGSALLEVIWTIIPATILVFIAVPTVRTIFRTAETPSGDTLVIEVIGHQWWWEFRYPELGITTASEVFVPVGQSVDLRMRTADVLHSFWVPQLAAKRDVFYGRDNRMWFTAEEAGVFPGQCAGPRILMPGFCRCRPLWLRCPSPQAIAWPWRGRRSSRAAPVRAVTRSKRPIRRRASLGPIWPTSVPGSLLLPGRSTTPMRISLAGSATHRNTNRACKCRTSG